MMELSKADKRVAREIIEKGLQQEFADGLNRSYGILEDWKSNKKSTTDTYHELFGHVRDYDKHIARRYDNMTGSNYLYIIAGQIIDKAMGESELQKLSPDSRDFVNRILSLNKL